MAHSPPSPPRLLPRALLLLGLLGALAGSRLAQADDPRAVTLPLAGGKALEGAVESADAREVVVRVGPEEVRRLPWTALAPLGVYRVRAALTPPADGARRLELAELAADLGLFAEARAEYEKALALGALSKEAFEASVAAAERSAVERGCEVARRLADAGDVGGALEVARGLKLGFAEAPNASAIKRLIEDLLTQMRAQEEAAHLEAAELAKQEAQLRRQKEILERRTRAEERISVGDEAAGRCAEAREKGQVSRAGKAGEEADAAYIEARKHLGRLRRILPADDAKGREQAAARLNDLDRKQFALLLALAKFYAAPGARNFARADAWAARAAYIDPVDPDLLELRRMLAEVRIRYRVSDVTNARPIVR